MKEEAKRNGKIRNESDHNFFPDINPPPEAAVESRLVCEGYSVSLQDRESGCQRSRDPFNGCPPPVFSQWNRPPPGPGFQLKGEEAILKLFSQSILVIK